MLGSGLAERRGHKRIDKAVGWAGWDEGRSPDHRKEDRQNGVEMECEDGYLKRRTRAPGYGRSSTMSSRHGDALDMAEFKAIVTASFDDIGSNVALNNNNVRALHPARLAPSSSEDKTARRSSPFSFLRKVKSHATSLLVSQSRPISAPPSRSHSFVPSLLPSRQPAPAPLASRNLLTRALGKSTHTPHVPDLEPKSFFFDDDEDKVDRRQTRRISTAPARPNARLSSAFAAAPILFGLTSPSASTPYLVPEKYDESRADLVHVRAYLILGPFSLTFL